MAEDRKPKQYDLEERTLKFARMVIGLTKIVPKSLANVELMKQLVRSSGSVGANYIEANEAFEQKGTSLCESRYVVKRLKKAGTGFR